MVSPQWENFETSDAYKGQQNYQSQSQQQQQEQLPEQQSAEWDDFQTPDTYQGPMDPTADEDAFGYLARNMLSLNTRGAEVALGTPGNIEKFSKDVLSNFPRVGGLMGFALSQLMGQERWERVVKGSPDQQQLLPTSKNIREITKTASNDYLEPKTPNEASLHELAEDVMGTAFGRGRVAVPGRGAIRNVLINNLGIPLAANAVKKVVEGLGFGEEKGIISKLGTWLSLSLAFNVNAARYASDLMNRGRNAMPANVQANVPRLENRLARAEATLLNADPRANAARAQIQAIRRDLANGNITNRSLMNSYDGINAAKRSRGLFDVGDRGDRRVAREYIDRVRHAVRDEILESGVAHPEALENWRNGVQSWAVIHQSRAMTNYVEDIARGPYGKALAGPAFALFTGGAWAGSKVPLVSGALAGTTPALYKSGQVLYRVFQDPRLATYYWNAVGAVAEKDLPTFLNNYGKLNKGLEKQSAISASKNKSAKAKKVK